IPETITSQNGTVRYVTAIAAGAFADCDEIVKISIPKTVSFIGDGAFAGCDNMVEIGLAGNSHYVFENGTLYNANKTVLHSYLSSNNALTFTVPNKVLTVNTGAFANATNLTTITFNKDVEIGEGAFANMSYNVIIFAPMYKSAGVYSNLFVRFALDNWADYLASHPAYAIFDYDVAGNVIDFHQPDEEGMYPSSAFQDIGTMSSVFDYEYVDDTVKIVSYTGTGDVIIVPQYINERLVTVIGAEAFRNVTDATKVILPDGLVTIEAMAFAGCTSLERVVFPSTVRTIGNNAFTGCTKLYEAYFVDDIDLLGTNVFANTYSNAGYGITVFGPSGGYLAGQFDSNIYNSGTSFNCFEWAYVDGTNSEVIITGIKSHSCNGNHNVILIPDSIMGVPVTRLADGLFDGNTAISEVKLPASLKAINDRLFLNCSNLTSVSIPSTVRSIGDMAFYNCVSLRSLVLPDVLMIGKYAFGNCHALTSFIVPDTVTSLSEGMFMNCYNLATIRLPNSLNTFPDYVFKNTRSLRTILVFDVLTREQLPALLSVLGKEAFRGSAYPGLNSPRVASVGWTSLGDKAFADTGIGEFDVSSIKTLGVGVFSNCPNLILSGESDRYTVYEGVLYEYVRTPHVTDDADPGNSYEFGLTDSTDGIVAGDNASKLLLSLTPDGEDDYFVGTVNIDISVDKQFKDAYIPDNDSGYANITLSFANGLQETSAPASKVYVADAGNTRSYTIYVSKSSMSNVRGSLGAGAYEMKASYTVWSKKYSTNFLGIGNYSNTATADE
ncbi:MAG: leucine-rich repeat domain-containing protein, partial [Clostridia bacterium]|nr:leucine-rich repeat domain-containing protein [Clostridia bacterium]